jgi:hypothetical protein
MADGCGGAFDIQATLMAAISGGGSLACCAEGRTDCCHAEEIRQVNHSILQYNCDCAQFQKRGRGMKCFTTGYLLCNLYFEDFAAGLAGSL